ncbi:MAG TPA: HAMP domain-containing sensor histidine kinase [Acidimicrobiales bacterium]|nr:HAMP domain-containing sensor histidine kinase [Acidimicrobiales bacterium]
MSLRLRLLLAVGAVALTALAIADVVTYQELRSFLYNRIDQSMEQSHIAIEGALGSRSRRALGRGAFPSSDGNAPNNAGGLPPSLPPTLPTTTSPASSTSKPANEASSQPPTCNGFAGLSEDLLRELDPGTFIEVRSASNAILCRSMQPAPLGGSESADPTLPTRITGFVSDTADFHEPTVYFTSADSQYRLRVSVLSGGPYSGGQLVIGLPVGSTISTLDRLVAVELAVSGAALLAALLLGWWLVRVSFRPLRTVEATAEAIARGELAERVPGDEARTEVGRLARAINVMLGRIERAFAQRDATEQDLRASEARMRQFVADASHELRTPLTAVSAYAELFEQGAATRADDLKRVMHGIRSETARMGSLVEDLLLLARLDEGRPLEREEVELLGVAAEAVQTASTVGPQWPVRLVASHPVEIVGDRMRLRQVLDNLLANVRTHCPAGTRTVVTVDTDHHDAVISVADDGPGLSTEEATRVFERFFRADPSRSRGMGGAGLGLSIVASITHAHSGTVTASSGSDGGTVFTVRLPLSGAPEQQGPEPDAAGGLDARGGFTAGS